MTHVPAPAPAALVCIHRVALLGMAGHDDLRRPFGGVGPLPRASSPPLPALTGGLMPGRSQAPDKAGNKQDQGNDDKSGKDQDTIIFNQAGSSQEQRCPM